MARIFPIKGIMYNSELDNDLGKFLCPPFDVVNDNDKNKLYALSEHNVIRLENGKSFISDDNDENKYTRSSKFLNDFFGFPETVSFVFFFSICHLSIFINYFPC